MYKWLSVNCDNQWDYFIYLQKKFHRLKKVKALDSDEDDEAESAEPNNDRQFIEQQLFEGERDEGDDVLVSIELTVVRNLFTQRTFSLNTC